jgi:hypothetical protein
MAEESTVPDLVAALASYFGGNHLKEQS